jgi:pimeloyl-ACP methyl ester carboxylesterase
LPTSDDLYSFKESKKPADLSKVHHPSLVANGDSDRMVPSKNTYDLAQRLPNSELVIYPDSGHGAVFQCRLRAKSPRVPCALI